MHQRNLGPFQVSAVGLGCMNVSHAYGAPPAREDAAALLLKALDLGYTHFDTATLYGGGKNETLLGEVLSPHRDKFTLASKCGLFIGNDGKREIDGRPERIKQACDDSLKRLNTDVIDLYYLHRLDKNVPIEESAGAFADLIAAGKIRSYGLSEVSAETLGRAHATHPVAAVQTEYSLWTRNAEIAVIEKTKQLGVTFVAFSPMARGFLPGKIGLDELETLYKNDLRRRMPRFQPDAYAQNLKLLEQIKPVAAEAECTLAEMALAWILSKSSNIVAIPGTTNMEHLAENARGADVSLSAEQVAKLDAVINQHTVVGPRYPEAQQPDIDTEEF